MAELIQSSVTGTKVRQSRIFRDFWLLTAGVALFGSLIFGLVGYWLIPSFLALLLLMLGLYPAVRYFTEGKTAPAVPAVPILTGAYAIQFALPVFLGDGTLWLVGGYRSIGEEALTAALVIALLSLVAFLVITYSRTIGSAIDKLPILKLHLNRTRAMFFCIFFGVFVLVASRTFSVLPLDAQAQYAALFKVLQTQMLVAIGVLAWLTYTNRSPWLRATYYLFIATAVVDGMSSGFLEAALVPVGIMFACQWIYRHGINKGLAAALIGAMLLLNPVKGEFREMVWYSSSAISEDSRINKALFWLESGFGFWEDVLQGRLRSEDAALQLVRRTSLIDLLAHVYETTPESVPYFMGETYSYFAYSLVPRFLWPEKPTTSANRTLAVEYGLTTSEGAERSTFGLSLLGEGYANFGWIGSVGIMAILAFVLRALQQLFTTRNSGPGGYALFLAFFVFFLNGLGSSAEILLGNLLQSMIASSILMYWVSERRRPSTHLSRGTT